MVCNLLVIHLRYLTNHLAHCSHPIGSLRRSTTRIVLTPKPLGRSVVIPAGTLVGVSHLASAYDPNVFPEPETFNPERFSGAETYGLHFTPFSGGFHACPGK